MPHLYCVADSDTLNYHTMSDVRPPKWRTRSINIHWLINLRCLAFYLHNATLSVLWLYST